MTPGEFRSVLVACEYSATVRDAFRSHGHDAWSCDIEPTEGDPRWHFRSDLLPAIRSRRWNLVILHVPCTAMAVCGNKHYGAGKHRHAERATAVTWTLAAWDAARDYSDSVALENPASVIFPILRNNRSADVQYIQPWQYGHPEQKKTGLALYNLPRLEPTKNVYDYMMTLPRAERERVFFMSPSEDRGKERARFYPGFADAMAEQWGAAV